MSYFEDRNRLRVFNRDTGDTVTVLKKGGIYSYADGDFQYVWAPDGRWLAATLGSIITHQDVVLIDTTGQRDPINLSHSGYLDM